MNKVNRAILFAFGQITKWQNLKIILLSGILVTIFWLIIGLLFQNALIALGAKILEFVPFSMVRSNGAFMLEGFLWFILVLITFAIIQAFFGSLYLKEHPSTNKSNTFTFYTLLLSAIIWGIVFFISHHYIYANFLRLLTWLPFETVEKSLAFIIAFYIIYNAIIITLLFVASFYSEAFISTIAQNSLNKEIVRTHILSSIKYTIKDTLIYMLLSIILFPLLFIPIFNFFVQIILWIWLYKDTLSFDALSLVYEKVDTALRKEHKVAIYLLSFVSILFNFVPILHIFGAYFGEIAFFYYFHLLKEEDGSK